jgi:IS5 family transposase
MQPKKPKKSPQDDLFRSRLDQILDPKHPLFRLANQIDWLVFEHEFWPLYADQVGRPGVPTRLMVGLHYLKHSFDESDESVVERFVENPYWQYFCGFEYFQHELPIDPSSMSRWRKRIGPDGIECLLSETLATAKRSKLLGKTHLKRVNVDTTVQEKAIAFPTDARLYEKMRCCLVREAEHRGIKLRQSYRRLGKRALQKQSRYAHARQLKRARRETRRLRTYLGRVLRDLRRKCPAPDAPLVGLFALAERLIAQQRHDSQKLYSIHAPEVECIAKGKAHKRYEFGCKVQVATTSRDHWVVAVDAIHGNPYDGHTLSGTIDQVERLTGQRPVQAFCDRGYRGKDHHPDDVEVYISGRRGLKRNLKKLLRGRSAIEPVIGHLKSESRMDRNYLLGRDGDRMNAMLAGCGANLRKLLRAFVLAIFTRAERLRWCSGAGPSLKLDLLYSA